MWEKYRFDFNSSSSAASATNQSPITSWQWDHGAGPADKWRRRSRADAPVDLTDASGNIYLQIDTATTSLGQNAVTSNDINIKGAPVNDATTAVFGGRFDTASTAAYYTSVQAVGDGVIKSVGLTNVPPAIKISWDKNTTAIGFVTVFLSFNKEYNK